VTRALVRLTAAVILLWVVLAVPASLFWDGGPVIPLDARPVLVVSGAAALVCWLPAALTLAVLTWWRRRRPPVELVAAFLLGVVMRMGLTLGGGLVVFLALLPVGPPGRYVFWVWLLVFYLATLTVETLLLVGPAPADRTTVEPPRSTITPG
jgi:hypothetical protein